MPTISKQIAEQLIERCKKQKRPKIYCVVRYCNTFFNKEDYSVCYRPYHYDGLFQSPAISGIEVLWKSERFQKDHPLSDDDYEVYGWLMSDEAKKLIEQCKSESDSHKTHKRKVR